MTTAHTTVWTSGCSEVRVSTVRWQARSVENWKSAPAARNRSLPQTKLKGVNHNVHNGYSINNELYTTWIFDIIDTWWIFKWLFFYITLLITTIIVTGKSMWQLRSSWFYYIFCFMYMWKVLWVLCLMLIRCFARKISFLIGFQM